MKYTHLFCASATTRGRMVVTPDYDALWAYEAQCLIEWRRSGFRDYPVVATSQPIRFQVDQYALHGDEDMPWCPSGYIVSERLAELLRTFQHDGLTFLPVSIMRTKSPSKPLKSPVAKHQYLMLVVNRVIDCADEIRSIWEVVPPEQPPRLRRFYFEPTKVPNDCNIFTPRGREGRIYISTFVRDSIESLGMTGCRFDEPGDLRPLW